MALVDTDMTSGRGKAKISPLQAAEEVISGLEKQKKEIWVAKAKLLKIINRLLPAMAERLMR